jgi:hypothetical protein
MKVKIDKFPSVGQQQISVDIDEWDTWSMDHTLAHIILPMLKQFKKTTHGAPEVDMMDVPKKLRASKAESALAREVGDTDANYFKRWDWLLDEMIFAFQSIITYDVTLYRPEDCKEDMERISFGFSMFGKYYQKLWD